MAERKPPDATDPDLALVPESLRLFAEAASIEAVEKLAEAFGGRVIYIPAAVSKNGWSSRLVSVLGADSVGKLIEVLGWGHFLVPMCTRLKRQRRNHAIRVAINGGKSIRQVAAQFGVHERMVRRATAIMRRQRATRQ